MPEYKQSFLKEAQRVKSIFVLPDVPSTKSLDDVIQDVPPLVAPISRVFRENISAVLAVASIPYRMSYTSSMQNIFEHTLMAERIRRIPIPGEDDDPEKREAEALAAAHRKFDAEASSDETMQAMINRVVVDLAHLAKDPDFDSAAHELLLETLVMTWGTFEAFVTSLLRAVLNSRPDLGARLLTEDATKRHFPFRGIPVESLAEHGFNVAQAMGDLLLASRHLDSLPVIKDMLNVIFPNEEGLRTRMSDRALWTFAQRRHLVVHRRGEIDNSYLAQTGEQSPVGSRLKIDPLYVEQCSSLVIAIAVDLLKAIERLPSVGAPMGLASSSDGLA